MLFFKKKQTGNHNYSRDNIKEKILPVSIEFAGKS